MSLIYLVRHPHTAVNLAIPAEAWDLSSEGRHQLEQLIDVPIWAHVSAIYPSRERKAIIPAEAAARHYRLPVRPRSALGEVDRHRYTAPDRDTYDDAVATFFASPASHPHGWEPAAAARSRFAAGVQRILARHDADESIAIIAHGVVLTVYMAQLRGINPTLDYWRSVGFCTIAAVDRRTMQPLTDFCPAPYKNVPLP